MSGVVDPSHEVDALARLNWHYLRHVRLEVTPASQPMTATPKEPRIHWWNRPSPWLWGLVVLLLIAVLAATQVQRISGQRPVRAPKASVAAPTAAPALSGTDYTQAMVAGRDFTNADLRGDRLEYLDLRGKDFQGADAAGAIFAGSLLNGANLSHSDLRGADMRDTCLQGATLTGAKLAGADFTGADIAGATVTAGATTRAIGWASIPASACPGT
jgi:hypothetical protein